MRTVHELQDLARHMEWADATVWRTVLSHQPSSLDSQLARWLHHMHTIQHAYGRLWSAASLDLPALSTFGEPRALARWGQEASFQLQSFLTNAHPSAFDRELPIPWSAQLETEFGRPVRAITVAESALQVTIHSAHHRGQISARLRELGASPPLVDFIAWVWLDKPNAQWPEADPDVLR
jgi:uncharacterized damage-inducible protein DinB